jgi:lambda family phage tail tape measure protein
MAAGSIVVDILANTGSFETGTEKASYQLNRLISQFQKASGHAVQFGKVTDDAGNSAKALSVSYDSLNNSLKLVEANSKSLGAEFARLASAQKAATLSAQNAAMLQAARASELNAEAQRKLAAESARTAAQQAHLAKQADVYAARQMGSALATTRLNGAVQQSQAGFRNMNQIIQNSSYQITDFVIQVSGGVSAMRAFSQQAPQFLGAFGPTGAMLGLVAALGGAFIPLAVEALSGAKGVKKFGDAVEEVDTATTALESTLRTISLDNVAKAFNEADAATRQFILSQMDARLAVLGLLDVMKSLKLELIELGTPGIQLIPTFKTLGSAATQMATQFNLLGQEGVTFRDTMKSMSDGTMTAVDAYKILTPLLKGRGEAERKVLDTIEKAAIQETVRNKALKEGIALNEKMQKAGSTGQIAIPGTKPTKADNTLEKMFENQRVGADKFVESMLRSNEQIQFQTSLLGRSAQEVEVLNAQYRIEAELQKTIQDLQRQNGTIAEEEMARMQAAAQSAIAIQTAMITSRQEQERSATYGMQRSMENYFNNTTNMAKNVEQVFTNAFDGMADSIVDFAMTGKNSFGDFAQSVIKQIMRIYVTMALVGLARSAIGAFASSSFQGPAYTGGSGEDASGWAPFADGGYTGDGGKYQPAGIVHAGEFVMNKEATSRIGVGNLYRMMRGYADGGLVGSAPMVGGANGGGNVTINVKNEAGADGYQATATARKNDTGIDIDIMVRKAVNSDLQRNGPISQQISSTYNLRRQS